jgi:hypothetical protein
MFRVWVKVLADNPAFTLPGHELCYPLLIAYLISCRHQHSLFSQFMFVFLFPSLSLLQCFCHCGAIQPLLLAPTKTQCTAEHGWHGLTTLWVTIWAISKGGV